MESNVFRPCSKKEENIVGKGVGDDMGGGGGLYIQRKEF
jgi:hypothetical protein